jgi:serralysin
MGQVSATLINAILAMDVYDRGVNPGLVVSLNTIGDHQVISSSIESLGSFQAASYQLVGDPTTRILAYRGTDQVADVLGWLGGAGIVGWPTQFPQAEAYFTQWGTTAHVSLTGHSLGGGLAGYIAALNGDTAYAFDAMPFEFAAEGRYGQIHGFLGSLFSNPASRYSGIHMVPTAGEVLSTIRALAPPVEAVAALAQFGPVTGPLAIANAASGIAAEQQAVLGAGVNFGLSATTLHSASLVVLLQYASDNAHTAWTAAASSLMTPLFDASIASAVGIAGASSDGTVGSGHWAASDKMKAMIGYSAVTDATGYGNTAIQALFNAGDVNGLSTNTAASGELQLGPGITDNNLWFVRSGSDLEIEVMGTPSAITVADWFDSSAYQLRDITAGGLKLDGQVAQLVQAMATYSSSHPGFDATAVAQAPSDLSLQGAIAAAWHT